jgi:hypothetical protein
MIGSRNEDYLAAAGTALVIPHQVGGCSDKEGRINPILGAVAFE